MRLGDVNDKDEGWFVIFLVVNHEVSKLEKVLMANDEICNC